MAKLHDLVDLEQLKEWKAFDQKSYNLLLKMIKKNKKMLVLATTTNAGISTVQNAIVNYIHRCHEETLVIPVLKTVNMNKSKSDKNINSLKKLCKGQKNYIASIHHTKNYKIPVPEAVKNLSGLFDCVLEMRNIEGTRTLVAIYEGKKSLKCIYSRE